MRLRRRRRKEEEGEREKYREGRGGEPPWQPKLHPPLILGMERNLYGRSMIWSG